MKGKFDVNNECLHSVTKYVNIRVKIRKCFRNMRRELGAKGSFYINQTVINMLCSHNNENREISERMFLSEGTVRNNISALLLKLKLRDRTQLAVYAVKNDYI